MHVFLRSLGGKTLVEGNPFELARSLLGKNHYPQVANRLAESFLRFCHIRFFGLEHLLSH